MRPLSVRHVTGSFALTSDSILKEKERHQLYSPVKTLSVGTYLWTTAKERAVELDSDYQMDLVF